MNNEHVVAEGFGWQRHAKTFGVLLFFGCPFSKLSSWHEEHVIVDINGSFTCNLLAISNVNMLNRANCRSRYPLSFVQQWRLVVKV